MTQPSSQFFQWPAGVTPAVTISGGTINTTLSGTPTVNVNGPISAINVNEYPSGATPLADVNSAANGTVTCTLGSAAGRTTYVKGFILSGSGATLALPVTATLGPLVGGKTMNFGYGAVAGVLVQNTPLSVVFGIGIPASGANTPIVLSCPALGVGNTGNNGVIYGYML